LSEICEVSIADPEQRQVDGREPQRKMLQRAVCCCWLTPNLAGAYRESRSRRR
jgi:hypothetical protein